MVLSHPWQYRGSKQKTQEAMKILEAQLYFSDTDIQVRRTAGKGQCERGKLTTQRTKPYFIKLENKILETVWFFQEAGRGKCKWLWRKQMGWAGSWHIYLRYVGVHIPPSVLPTYPLVKASLVASSGLSPSFSAFWSLFHLWPWTVKMYLQWRKFTIGLCYNAAVLAPGEEKSFLLALTRKVKGPWSKPQSQRKMSNL